MKRGWLTVALMACVFGVVSAGLSLQNYLRIEKAGIVDEASFCSVSEYVNCDVVEASSYASINGFPVAALGLIYYILVLIFLIYARYSHGFKKPTVAFVWWSSVPAVLYSVLLSYVSAVILRTLCLTCIGMYITNILLFVSLYFAMRMPFEDGVKFLWGYWATLFTRKKIGIDFMPKFGIHLLASFVIFGMGFVIVCSAIGKSRDFSRAEVDGYVSHFYKQSKYEINFNKDVASVWGTKGAPVTIVEFSDYRCPFCRISAFMIKPFLSEYKKDIAYYFVNYPLDSTCNHYMQHQIHPGSCLGAKAGICAGNMNKFWEYHDELFRSTESITVPLVLDVARKLGIDEKKFTECLNSAETERRLKADIEISRRIYITGTPWLFVNNRRLMYWRNPEILREIVKMEIEASKRAGAN